MEEPQLSTPLPRFPATLRLRLLDYTGHEIAVREVNGQFPNQVEVDFGKTPTTGYYAVYASLHSAEGRLIMTYPADGFSVVAGSVAQQQRLAHKKLWNNDYYALADGNNSFVKQDGYFAWLERMGIYRSYGSYPGVDAQYTAGALIDGLPYQAVDTRDNAIQAAYFGSTLMLWRGDETIGPWPLKLDPGKDWVFVNVVGQLQSLPVDPAGNAVISLSASPVYVLPRADYQRLTRY